MEIDLPDVLAEVTVQFQRYEKALVNNDVAVLDELFRSDKRTLRYGIGENLYGYEAIMTMAAVRRDNSVSLFAVPAIIAERRSDGSTIVRSTTPLKPAARSIGDWLEHWARTAPDRIFLGERTGDVPWTTVTYREALKQVRSIAAWALAQGLSADHPLVVLSDNSVDHALLALGAMHGFPSLSASSDIETLHTDLQEQTAGGPQ